MNYIDAEIIKDGTSYLVSDNELTGTSLEVLSFVVGGIEQSQNFNDGIDGRSRLFQGSEDKYRKITLMVRAGAEYLQRVAHLRDAVNDLFSGEYYIREMRIKAAEVKYESPGQKTGNMNLGTSEYVNGKQFKVKKVSSIESDDLLQSDLTVELETTDLPYAESIYTTKELHDTGYDAAVAKYGTVDNIDASKTQYVFEQGRTVLDISGNAHENGSIFTSNGQNANNADYVRTRGYINVVKDQYYELKYTDDNSLVSYVRIFQYDDSGNYLHSDVRTTGALATFTAVGSRIRLLYYPAATSISASEIGTSVIPYLDKPAYTTNFSLWNAGNVTVEPEFMELYIQINSVTSSGNLSIKNITTGDEFKFEKNLSKRHIVIDRMNIRNGTTNAFRDTNRRFIKIAPGKNEFQITGEAWNNILFIFKFYYK